MLTMLCALLGAVNRQMAIDQNEREAVKVVRQLGGWVHYRLRYSLRDESDEDRYERQLIGDRTVTVVSHCGEEIGDGVCNSLHHLRNLRRLYLDETKITDAGLKQIGNLRRLERLSVSGTRISGHGIKELQELKSLQKLNISQASITDQAVDNLIRIHGLRKLVIYDTQISELGIARLRRACPALEIFA